MYIFNSWELPFFFFAAIIASMKGKQIETIWKSFQFNNKRKNKSSKNYEYFHIQQEYDWDCGIVCCRMALLWCNINKLNEYDFQQVLLKKVPLWTIELMDLLKKYDHWCDVCMCTEYVGVKESHRDMIFYSSCKDIDFNNIKDKFNLAYEKNWDIKELIITDEELQVLLCDDNKAVIILIDANEINQSTTRITQQEYSGHYIFLLNYDEVNDIFHCLDPADPSHLNISASTLHRARKKDGTDQDMLIITRKNTF